MVVYLSLVVLLGTVGFFLYYRYNPVCPECMAHAWEKGWAGWRCLSCGTWFEKIDHRHFRLRPKHVR